MANLIYHYTNLDVFKKIIEGDSLLLSDMRESNDLQEMIHYSTEMDGLEVLGEFWKNIKVLVDIIPEMIGCYALCFAKQKDLLSQWDRYAEKGKGVAIGFDKEKLDSLIERVNLFMQDSPKEEFPDGYRKILMKDVKYKDLRKSIPIQESIECVEKKEEYLEKCAFTKHKGFAEEKEIRIAVLVYNEKKEEIQNEYLQLVKINQKNGYLLKYIKEAIVEVFAGPICSDEDIVEIENLRKANNCTYKIGKSEIPYRPK